MTDLKLGTSDLLMSERHWLLRDLKATNCSQAPQLSQGSQIALFGLDGEPLIPDKDRP